jgi:endoribonuclease Nob1
VLDTSLFFTEYPLSGDMYTTPSVIDELVDLRSKCRYETLLAQGLQVQAPTLLNVKQVQKASKKTGDAEKISATDCDILALALDLGATAFTDDFAVQNVACEIGVLTHPIQQRSAKKRIWKFRCRGCGRFSHAPGECPVCGSPIKRTIK